LGEDVLVPLSRQNSVNRNSVAKVKESELQPSAMVRNALEG